MTIVNDFLFEMGCEELPAKVLPQLQQSLHDNIVKALAAASLTYENCHVYATPRRLAVVITACLAQQPENLVEKRGPAFAAAFDVAGNPSQACIGFAKSCGVSPQDLIKIDSEKGVWLVYRQLQPGKTAEALLPEIMTQALAALPIAKAMRWGSGEREFLRPVRWLVLLWGDAVIPATILGIDSDRKTYGHRFHAPDAITILAPRDYVALLRQAKVMVDYQERREFIKQRSRELCQARQLHAVIADDLLNEVTGLVEWPVPLLISFEEAFLRIPAEALIAAMQDHQKCFYVVDDAGNLQAYFITVSNIDSRDQERVVIGNQRVMRARLSDAAFFYDSDLKQSLHSRQQQLATVTFQARLGTLLEKTERVTKLAQMIAKDIGADISLVQRTAQLAKCDLMSAMVGEFPELQGVMGKYYARHDGEPVLVTAAIEQQYWPRFAKDKLPESTVAASVALAERIDTLVGIFGINLIPTGDKDPYALRRAALGVIRIIVKLGLTINLLDIIQQAIHQFDTKLANAEVLTQVHQFILERVKVWYHDQGVAPDVVAAVIARQQLYLQDFDARISAVLAFRNLPTAASLAAANKRVSRLLQKEWQDTQHSPVNPALLSDNAEKILAERLAQITAQVTPMLQQKLYTEALQVLAELKDPVDSFFDDVMVMVDDKMVRDNRLALLAKLQHLFMQIADISLLQ